MKKLTTLLFFIFSFGVFAQTSTGQEQEFDYGIKNNSTQTITTPPYLTTTGMDGTQGKIPSALIEKTDNKQNSLAVDGTGVKYPTVDAVNAALPKNYSQIVYVNSTDPGTATIFDTSNPPITNNNSLKTDVNNLYVGTDASAWVYDMTTFNYVTKALPSISNFYLKGSSLDAGSDKIQAIVRTGSIESSSFIKTGGTSSQFLKANGSVDSTTYQPLLTNPTTGTGTTNTITKWTGTTTQGNSSITDNGTSLVSIGLPTEIKGTAASDGGQLGSELTTTATGTNWTGTGFATGYTHTTGSTIALTSTLSAVTNNLYQITYTITGRTTGSITINYGGVAIGGITASGNSGPKATTTGVLTLTPTTDFNGTVVISVKVISPSDATQSWKNSSGVVTNELRASSSNTNVFFGEGSGGRNTTGTSNTAIGRLSLQNNTTGSANVSIGIKALINNTTGPSNTSVGSNSMLNNTTGASNTAIGNVALTNNTTGILNSAIGTSALSNNTTGSGNVASGSNAGRYIADGTTPATILNNSILLGYNTKVNADNETNQIVIGYNETGLGSNSTILGNSSTTKTAIRGRLLSGTTTDNGTDQLQVNGTISATALTLSTAPTTSAGTYDILTRNTSTGVVEKVTNTTISPWVKTGDNIKTTNIGKTFIGLTDTFGFSYDYGLGVSGKIATSSGFRGNSFSDLSEYPLFTSNGSGLLSFSSRVKLKAYTVATLPFGEIGAIAYVTDALAPTYMTTIVGGGTVVTPVFYNGTNWVAH